MYQATKYKLLFIKNLVFDAQDISVSISKFSLAGWESVLVYSIVWLVPLFVVNGFDNQ